MCWNRQDLRCHHCISHRLRRNEDWMWEKIADMIIKYEPQIKEEVEVCMMIKDSIDDEKVSRQKQFDRFCYYLGGVKQLLDKKAA